MCGRFVQYSDPEIYASQFDRVRLFWNDAERGENSGLASW